MKKLPFLFLILAFLTSCESQENKNSRLILDKYVRKLNSMTLDVVLSRSEEGSQSKLTMNRFYDRYTSKFEDINNDLEFETISEKYSESRNLISNIARSYYSYINRRKIAVSYISDLSSAYSSMINYKDDYIDYIDKMTTSEYSKEFYLKMARQSSDKLYEKELEYELSSYKYLIEIDKLDSTAKSIDSISRIYNRNLAELKLKDTIVIRETLYDTINDWLLTSKNTILESINEEY